MEELQLIRRRFKKSNKGHFEISSWSVNILSSSRILGGLLCLASAAVAILHIYYGYIVGSVPQGYAFALPVTVFVLVATVLGFWLGWIMVTTEKSHESPTENGTEEELE